MIKIVKGDLLAVERGVVAHQVNCQGKFNSGVAEQVRKKYPHAFNRYSQYVDDFVNMNLRKELLGTINYAKVGSELWVANLFGQYNYGYNGNQFTITNDLFRCFKELRENSEKSGLSVHMPYMIGCYRGGADWKEVENLLLTAFDGYEVTLHKYHEG